MTFIPAARDTFLLVRDPSDDSIVRVPVVGYEAVNSMAFPITPLPIHGLLQALRALQTPDGMVIDRGSPVPFANEAEWLSFCGTVTPEDEPEVAQAAVQPARKPAATAAAPKPTTEAPAAAGGRRRAKDKVFEQKTFWRRIVGEVTQITICEGGVNAPREDEGWVKIKRDDYANLKREAKSDEEHFALLDWPISTEAVGEPAAEEEAGDDDFGGLV